MVNPDNLTVKQQERYQRILDIAGEMFLDKGFSATSMAEICQQVGGSKATVYHYFASKEELFQAFMFNEVDRHLKVVFALPEQSEDVAQTLFDLGMRFLELLTLTHTVDVFRLALHESRQFPEIGTFFYNTGPARSHAILTRFIARAVEQGKLVASDPMIAAEQFLMLCQAELTLPFQFGVRPEPTREERSRIIQEAVTTFMARFGK